MIEVLFFAVIAAYIFYRLWSVLGTRTGHEQPRERFMKDADVQDDNVIIMPKRQVNAPADGREEAQEIIAVSYGPYAHQLEKVKVYEPSFDLDDFEEKAGTAYKMIVEAFNAGDTKTLEMLVDKKVFREFDHAIRDRKHLGHTVKNEFTGAITCSTENVEVRGPKASISLKIYSQQRLVTYDKDGEILDNVDESVVRLTEYWTFTRDLGSDDPSWLLTKTHSKPL